MGLHSEQRLKDYVIKEPIASGGMGEVWRAWDASYGRFVAIKAITSDLLSDPKFTDRFLDEGRRHSRLNHPNIVPIKEVFKADNENCLVMELIEGISLDHMINNQPDGRLDVGKAIPIVEDLLSALNYAHQQGIIHRDVKPSNVLLDRDGRAHLIDFGIALSIGENRRTRTGQAIGTPHYMSPEQIVRPREIDHRSDVYSVGCVFYEMLTGQPPFTADSVIEGDTDFAIKKAHVNNLPVAPKDRVDSVPDYINDIVMKALEKLPERRIPGCAEFLRLLSEPKKPVTGSRKKSWLLFIFVLLLITWLYFLIRWLLV